MNQINVYLTFDGNCRETMNFYADALGIEPQIFMFKDMPNCPDGAADRIMHASLTKGGVALMASDTMPGTPFHPGNNFSISVNAESAAEIDTLMAALSAGGTVTMPAQDMFWGAYFGMLTDKFGLQWMFNHEKPKAE